MCGRSVSPLLFALLLIFFAPLSAQARKQSFVTGSPFGIGFAAGGEKVPVSSFAAPPTGSKPGTSYYFLFMPRFDFYNVVLQAYAGWHFYPKITGAGTQGTRYFTDASQSGNLSYGARVMLSPFINKDATGRGYLVLGIGQASAKLKNTRTYTATNGDSTSYTENVSGSGLETQLGLGAEFFVLQNYSMGLEAGYTQRNINSFNHDGTNDVTGAVVEKGAEALDSNERNKAFHVWSPYVQLSITLNL